MVRARFCSSAAFPLKNWASRPRARIRRWTASASGRVSRRSRCAPKMFMPMPASSTAVAAPNPLLAPRISAQGCLLMTVHPNLALFIAAPLQADLHPPLRHPLRKSLAPFHQHHRVAVEQLVEPQGSHLAGILQAVQVHVVNAPGAVFVDQRKGGAGHL